MDATGYPVLAFAVCEDSTPKQRVPYGVKYIGSNLWVALSQGCDGSLGHSRSLAALTTNHQGPAGSNSSLLSSAVLCYHQVPAYVAGAVAINAAAAVFSCRFVSSTVISKATTSGMSRSGSVCTIVGVLRGG